MNIISKLYSLKHSALIAREKFRESVWRNAFQTSERAITTSENEKKSHPLKTSLPNIGEKYMPLELT